jgi:hypothetical protein
MVTQRRGARWSCADAYLKPVLRRRNLTLLTEATATRVLFVDVSIDRADEPAIIEHKNARLTTERCPNPLQRRTVDFSSGELPAALRECDPDVETLIVIEGVFMYLDKAQVDELLQTLSDRFPSHTLVCDLMNRVFFKRHMGKMYDQILALGSEFKLIEAQPENTFLHRGYQQPSPPISIVGRARDFKAFRIPDLLLRTALRTLRDGYRVHTFERSR